MSNRSKWAHWKKQKPEKHPLLMKWCAGSVGVVLGGLLILSGLQGLSNHVLWYKGFNFSFGIPVVHQTLGLIVVGTAFLIAGITILFGPK
jgi:hypothetical protein